MVREIEKKFLVFEIIASELVSLLRRENLSPVVNMLTSNLKLLHIPNRDFFNLKILHNDQ